MAVRKTACRSQLSPSTTYISGMKLVRFGNKHLYLLSHLAGPRFLNDCPLSDRVQYSVRTHAHVHTLYMDK